MNLQTLTEQYSVAPQIQASDVETLAGLGFVAIICNRPDFEDPGQPSAEDISAACVANDIAFFHIPVTTMPIAEADVAQHRDVVANASGKVLGYCRSGQRSAVIFAASA